MIFCNHNYYSGFYEREIIERVNIDTLIESEVLFDDCYILPCDEAELDCPYQYSDGLIFLNASCNLFAKALHEIFGYEVYEVSGSGNHWYCKTQYNNKTLYIDVRGATSDFAAFSKRYGFIKSETNPDQVPQTDLSFSDEPWRDTGYLFACSIIADHEEYYSTFPKE
ncbi:hypothetical protein [Lachnospira multipara]|uniref:hypothetical protein n=1 Tax=Lachnospira multipara TaxID=28051 RepID=UPI000486C8BF|nr:hypothetical protein [Lachnospira multipara]